VGQQEHEFVAGAPALTEVERLAPVLKRECPRDRHLESTFCGEPRELPKNVVAQGGIFSGAVADPELCGCSEVGDREDAARVAARDPDEVGQHEAGRRGP